MRRVVITGMGIISPIGNSPDDAATALARKESGIRQMPEWTSVGDLKTRVAGTADTPDPKVIPRAHRRTMGRVALLGAFAASNAASDARLTGQDMASGAVGLSMGSTTGSAHVLEQFYREYFAANGIGLLEGTLFMKVMSHTVAANVAATLGIKGRVTAPCCACASSAQAIGEGFEAIRAGLQDVMLCGGSDEVHATTAGVFNILGAASTSFNDRPHQTPRPFDTSRDGLVVSEGAAVVVLEEYERAQRRGACIYGEVLGYSANCDAANMALSGVDGMASCIRGALYSAGIAPEDLDYVNAHATGTVLGDACEAEALRATVGDSVPVSSTKGHVGHTLGACGAMEAIFCVQMMRRRFLAPTLNLDMVDDTCSGLRHLGDTVEASPELILSNSFAFGGINAAVVLAKA